MSWMLLKELSKSSFFDDKSAGIKYLSMYLMYQGNKAVKEIYEIKDQI